MRTPAFLSTFGALAFLLLLIVADTSGQAQGNAHSAAAVTQGFTRHTYHDKDQKIIKETYQVKDTIRNVPHGRYVSYFLNGKIESKGQFTNNETSGVWEFYYETGKLKMRGILFKSANYGMWEYFFESGQKSMEGIINGRDREGEWKTYYESGHIRETGSYVKNQRQGHWKTNFEDGTLKGEIDYTDDHGRYIEYFQSGKVRSEGPKSGARSVGLWRYFSEDGTLQSEGEYKEGRKSGIWTNYYPSGKVSSKGTLNNDEQTGQWEHWFEDGTPSATGSYDDKGKKTGKWTSWSSSGKVKTEVTYINGRGEYVEYYESGKPKVKGSLVDEKREGNWEFYYENGQREGACEYKSGKGIYHGYFTSGALQTKGAMDGDLKTGTWEIYENDGTLSGYYRPFYDDKKLSAEITGMATKQKAQAQTNHIQSHSQSTKKASNKRHTGYFTPRYNEAQGIIFGTNPLWLAAGQLPLAIEFYMEERIGHEFEFIGIRDPFFVADSEVTPGKQFERGYSIAIKQKFYNPLNVGMWYFGHEVRFTNVGHYVNEFVTTPASATSVFTFNATEQRIEWGALLGYRITRKHSASGLTVDAFVSADIGYRSFDVDESNVDRFTSVPQSSFASTFHFGINIGNVFSFR
ncbi:MAG: toxin-antitoxin system YwqK family antitoxin [Chryseolinea sp.]